MITNAIERIVLGAITVALVSAILYTFGAGLQMMGLGIALELPALVAGFLGLFTLFMFGYLTHLLGDFVIFFVAEHRDGYR